MVYSLLRLITVASILLITNVALAGTFPDILIGTDGSEVRGTILEKNTDGSGTFQKFNGELVEFDASTTSYVGPAVRPNDTPSAPKSRTAEISQSNQTTTMVTTNVKGLSMYEPGARSAGTAVAVGSRGGYAVAASTQENYRRICILPGNCSLRPGTMELAFLNPNGGFGGIQGHIKTVVTVPEGLAAMHVNYISHRDYRSSMWSWTSGLLIGGLLGMVAGTAAESPGIMFGGLGSMAGSLITMVLAFKEDEVEIRLGQP